MTCDAVRGLKFDLKLECKIPQKGLENCIQFLFHPLYEVKASFFSKLSMRPARAREKGEKALFEMVNFAK